MLTQQEIASHLDLSQAAVSGLLADLGIDWRQSTLDELRTLYIRKLRTVASGRELETELTRERIETERITRQTKTLDLAERQGRLVSVEQLEPELLQMVMAFRAELLARDDKLASDLSALYGVTIDVRTIRQYTHDALAHLARYDPGSAGGGAAPGGAGGAAGPDVDGRVGARVPENVAEVVQQAGEIQP